MANVTISPKRCLMSEDQADLPDSGMKPSPLNHPLTGYTGWLYTYLKRYGIWPVILAITGLSILVSVLITFFTIHFVDKTTSVTGLILAALIPAILAPTFTYQNFRLLMLIEQADEQLRLLSSTDELTTAFNRRYFLLIASQEFERAWRYHIAPFSIAMLDFDDFKTINDNYGHLAGDAALKHVSAICQALLRKVDTFARYGGDEFVFLFPETNLEQAVECLERILSRVREEPLIYEMHVIPMAVSIGTAMFVDSMQNLDDLLKEADLALYAGKDLGGDRVSSIFWQRPQA